jgi:hypothetical protein
MKIANTNRGAWPLALIAMLLIAPPCFAQSSKEQTTMEDIKQETQDLMQSLKAYTIAQRDEALQKTRAALDNLDQRIDAMETGIDNNWEKMDAAAREQARASLRALRKQRMQVAEWYGSLKSSSAEAWGHMKQGLADAYRSLYRAWEQSEKDFRADKKASQN